MSVVLKTVRCINSAGQEVLRRNMVYQVIADVKRAATGRFPAQGAPFASGYVVREKGEIRCLSGVFNRERFEDVADSTTNEMEADE